MPHQIETSQPFFVKIDASHFHIAGILLQNLEGKESIVACVSRPLTSQEKVFTTVELELLAFNWVLDQFKQTYSRIQYTIYGDDIVGFWQLVN